MAEHPSTTALPDFGNGGTDQQKDDDDSLATENIDDQDTGRKLQEETKINKYFNSGAVISGVSPDFNYKQVLQVKSGLSAPKLDSSTDKVSAHLSKIENIKNTMLMSFSGYDGMGGGRVVDRNHIEERIHETKNQIRMEQEINNIQDNFDDQPPMEYGYDSDRQEKGKQDDFSNQLRQSL